MERTFDRRPFFDERSRAFPIRTLLADKPARSYSWRHVQLDQGSEGACVGHGVTMDAAARPKPFFGKVETLASADLAEIQGTAFDVYRSAQKIDEWPGEDYEGTSVLAGLKIGQTLGFWKEYRWALGPGPDHAANDVIQAVGYHGPVILGTSWHQGMSNPDDKGFLRPTGAVLGGHCYLVTRYSKPRDAVWTPNSWGGAGQGWISRHDLAELLAAQGEAAMPVMRQ